jgi:hypothetical protein
LQYALKHKTRAGGRGRECRCKQTHKNTSRWEGTKPWLSDSQVHLTAKKCGPGHQLRQWWCWRGRGRVLGAWCGCGVRELQWWCWRGRGRVLGARCGCGVRAPLPSGVSPLGGAVEWAGPRFGVWCDESVSVAHLLVLPLRSGALEVYFVIGKQSADDGIRFHHPSSWGKVSSPSLV